MPQTAKDRWNASHYKQMKFSLSPTIAKEFKSTCEEQDLSMASVIGKFMCEFSKIDYTANKKPKSDKTVTRKQRRKEMCTIISMVTAILTAEKESLNKTPDNFRNTETYEESERIVDALGDALESLEDVYNQ